MQSRNGKPKAHHFVPQCLLRRFTSTGRRGGLLTSIDLRTRATQRIPTNRAAVIDDFYRFRGIANEHLMEETLGEIVERQGAKAIHAVTKCDGDIDDDTLSDLLVFVSTLHIRTPKFRRWYLAESARFTEQWLHATTRTPDLWRQYVGSRRAQGDTTVSDGDFEAVREAFRPGNMKLSFPPEEHVRAIVDHSEYLCHMLQERNWSLVRSAEGSGGFIVSDNPVTLVWSSPGRDRVSMPVPPGFLHKLTEVFVPLGSEVGLLGRFDNLRLKSSRFVTAMMNSRILAQADHTVYARDLTFSWLEAGTRLRSGDALVEPRRSAQP